MVLNVHERLLPLAADHVGELLETLASDDDQIWSSPVVEPIELDRGLELGSQGGHGPVRYHVVEHTPGRAVWFEFEPGIGLEGRHGFEVVEADGGTLLRHTIDAKLVGIGHLTWPLGVRAVHDTALEDMLDHVEMMATGVARRGQRTPRWVRWVSRPKSARSATSRSMEDRA